MGLMTTYEHWMDDGLQHHMYHNAGYDNTTYAVEGDFQWAGGIIGGPI